MLIPQINGIKPTAVTNKSKVEKTALYDDDEQEEEYQPQYSHNINLEKLFYGRGGKLDESEFVADGVIEEEDEGADVSIDYGATNGRARREYDSTAGLRQEQNLMQPTSQETNVNQVSSSGNLKVSHEMD